MREEYGSSRHITCLLIPWPRFDKVQQVGGGGGGNGVALSFNDTMLASESLPYYFYYCYLL